ncbi:MAG: OadG family protein [Bacteroidales bacterium]|jgi:hypothetical protein|nr:OadG family protein [Bacteroidales bacterium]
MNNLILDINWSSTLTLVIVSFSLVISIMFLFVGILKIMGVISKSNKLKKDKANTKIEPQNNTKLEVTDLEYVAIATAINLYFDVNHDEESLILTIKNNPQIQSPWNAIK